MSYDHFIRIRRQSGQTTDRATGDVTLVYVALYEGPADVQDEGAVLSRRVEASEEMRESEATIFLVEGTDMSAFEPEDVVDISWSGFPPDDPDAEPSEWDADAEVTRVVRLDEKLMVRSL